MTKIKEKIIELQVKDGILPIGFYDAKLTYFSWDAYKTTFSLYFSFEISKGKYKGRSIYIKRDFPFESVYVLGIHFKDDRLIHFLNSTFGPHDYGYDKFIYFLEQIGFEKNFILRVDHFGSIYADITKATFKK